MDVDVLGLMIRIRSGGGAGFEAMMMIGYGLWMAKCRGGSRRRKRLGGNRTRFESDLPGQDRLEVAV